ncbi:hypothetical protein OSG_eHP40_00220 [environmental Halophage eHP-40]|nr:hypothetical protein OSG_eHP40_00220 [environmental Halophage eHP-40]
MPKPEHKRLQVICMASENESDSFLPTLNDDADAETTIRGLIPWLENPKQCECGICIATTGYVGTKRCIWIFGTARIVRIDITVTNL